MNPWVLRLACFAVVAGLFAHRDMCGAGHPEPDPAPSPSDGASPSDSSQDGKTDAQLRLFGRHVIRA